MKASIAWLKNLVREAGRHNDERYVSEEEAKDEILNTDGDTVAGYDLIDEDTGEIYLKAGESFNLSPWNPDHRLDKRRAAKDETYAKRGGVWDEYFGEDEDDADEDDWFEAQRTRKQGLEDAYRAAVKEFSEQFSDFMEESPDISPEDAAPDLADNFFHEYPEWRDWAQALQMSRTHMKEAIADYVYDAMKKGAG